MWRGVAGEAESGRGRIGLGETRSGEERQRRFRLDTDWSGMAGTEGPRRDWCGFGWGGRYGRHGESEHDEVWHGGAKIRRRGIAESGM